MGMIRMKLYGFMEAVREKKGIVVSCGLFLAGFLLLIFLVVSFWQKDGKIAQEDDSIVTVKYVWFDKTDGVCEEICGYLSKNHAYWLRNGVLTDTDVAAFEYTSAVLEFDYLNEKNADAMEAVELSGASGDASGDASSSGSLTGVHTYALEEGKDIYASLLWKGYAPLYVKITSKYVDAYLKKGETVYRYLLMATSQKEAAVLFDKVDSLVLTPYLSEFDTYKRTDYAYPSPDQVLDGTRY
jgi:hypothetical protein